MKMKLLFPVDTFSGALSGASGIVASVWRGIQTGRKFVIPRNPNSANQTLIRNILTQASQAFQNISAVNKESWAAFCASNPITWEGKKVVLPEISQFVKINCYRLLNGQSISNTPPTDKADFVATAIDNFAYDTTTTQLTFDITHTADPVTNKLWALYVTRSLPSLVRKARETDYVLIDGAGSDSIIAVTATKQSVTITTPRYADWEDGDYLSIKALPLSPGYNPGTSFDNVDQITVSAS